MSFILDALKKSETERQQQGGGEFSSVPASSGDTRPLRWLWVLAALLGINLAVLLGILLRPDTGPADTAEFDAAMLAAEPVAAIADPVPEPAGTAPTFADQVQEARRQQPVVDRPANESVAVGIRAAPAPVPVQSAPAVDAARIPTIDELLLDGSLQLPELHIDIHVFSDNPDERFVFINMVKHREQSRLAEGPLVSEITNDGVILEHQGRTFLLPRE